MIEGTVDDDLQAVIDLTITGQGRRKRTLRAQVDTGFTDYLTLPQALIDALKLPQQKTQARAILADGSQVLSPYYRAEVLWDGVLREAFVISMESNILIGMALMEGYDLHVAVNAGGAVRLTKQETL